MTRPAIVVPVISQLVEEARAAVKAVADADALAAAYDKKLTESREILRARRIELGMLLRKARETLPKRGTAENGWGAFLAALEMAETTAYDYMKLAGWTSGRSLTTESGDKEPPPTGDTPPPKDEDVPADLPADVVAEADRNQWCTPKRIADALGPWDLDPCSNERSHIQAAREYRLERGEDGLVLASFNDGNTRAFINPPYARGQVIQWIQAYAHTRFCFLLKFDPSTAWFELLMQHTKLVLIPKGERVEFEPPPGIEASSVQFPHALFFAEPALATDAIKALCFPGWIINRG